MDSISTNHGTLLSLQRWDKIIYIEKNILVRFSSWDVYQNLRLWGVPSVCPWHLVFAAVSSRFPWSYIGFGKMMNFHHSFCNSSISCAINFRSLREICKVSKLPPKRASRQRLVFLAQLWRRPSFDWHHLLRTWGGHVLEQDTFFPKVFDGITLRSVGVRNVVDLNPFWSAYWRKSLAPGTAFAAPFSLNIPIFGWEAVPSLTFELGKGCCLKQFHPVNTMAYQKAFGGISFKRSVAFISL